MNALDTRAAQRARTAAIPALERVHLTDYKVRVLDTQQGHRRGHAGADRLDRRRRTWTTIGVSENIIEASWQALSDSIVYGLLHTSADRVDSVMAAPEYVPLTPVDQALGCTARPTTARSVAAGPARRARAAASPRAARLGQPGPDQGFAFNAGRAVPRRLRLAAGEHADDAIPGCVGVALRRASLFGRAPVVHDLTVAFTVWGFLDDAAPAELAARRKKAFEGLATSPTTTRSSAPSSTAFPRPRCA